MDYKTSASVTTTEKFSVGGQVSAGRVQALLAALLVHQMLHPA